MTDKTANSNLARELFSSAFWRPEYFPRNYSATFTMEFPSAPPGMPNFFNTWESECCFEWLNRTVLNWSVNLEEFYSTPNPDQFWAIGICKGDVIWGKDPGHFQSKFFARMEMKNGKVNYLKGWMDSIAFLLAANLDVPWIKKATDDPRVDEWLANTPARFTVNDPKNVKKTEDPYEGLDMSQTAIEKRLQDNLMQNMCGIDREKYRASETFHPDYKRGAWFIPDFKPWSELSRDQYSIYNNNDPVNNQKQDEASIRGRSRQHAWVKLSSPWMYRDTRGKNYPTDDPYVYFAEMFSNGPCLWAGNGFERGHYHQQYLMVLKFDKAGRELLRDEVLCPQYKYASTQIPLPSFPFYA